MVYVRVHGNKISDGYGANYTECVNYFSNAVS